MSKKIITVTKESAESSAGIIFALTQGLDDMFPDSEAPISKLALKSALIDAFVVLTKVEENVIFEITE